MRLKESHKMYQALNDRENYLSERLAKIKQQKVHLNEISEGEEQTKVVDDLTESELDQKALKELTELNKLLTEQIEDLQHS